MDEVEFCGPDDLVFFDVPGSNKDDAEMMLDEDVGGRTSFTGVFTVRTGRHICSVLIIIGLLVGLIFLGSIDDDAERMRDDDADVDNCTSFAGALTLGICRWSANLFRFDNYWSICLFCTFRS